MKIGEYLKQHYSSIDWSDETKTILLDGNFITGPDLKALARAISTECNLSQLSEGDIIKSIKRVVKSISAGETKNSKSGRHGSLPDWTNGMDLTDKGTIIDSVYNIILLLQQHKYFKDKLAYNEVTQQEEFDGNPINDITLAQFSGIISGILHKNITSSHIKEAVISVCHNNHINPLRDTINVLKNKWDGVERLDSLFIKAFECDDTPYIRESTRQLFYAWINRMLNPGCVFNIMFMFEGEQGIGKSELLKRMLTLIGGKTVEGMKFDPDKRNLEKIARNHLCVFDELGNMRKADLEFVKEFLSRTTDTFDEKYKGVRTYKRHCIFVGNLNPDRKSFLKDVTVKLERRFVIFPCHAKGIASMPEKSTAKWWNEFLPDEYLMQIWAEAAYRVFAEPDFNWMGWTPERVKAAEIVQQDYSSINDDDIVLDELTRILSLKFNKDEYLDYDEFMSDLDNAKNKIVTSGGVDLLYINTVIIRRYLREHLREDRSTQYLVPVMNKLGWVRRKIGRKHNSYNVYTRETGTQTTLPIE